MIPKIPRKNNNKRAILLIHIFTCSFCQKCIKLTCTINITTSNTRDTINLAIKQCYNNNIIPCTSTEIKFDTNQHASGDTNRKPFTDTINNDFYCISTVIFFDTKAIYNYVFTTQ